MYICFNALKLGWKEGLRPFIGLDGTFLKDQCKGQILVAMAQDAQNCFYPLAWAVVDKETTRTWIWFLQLLNNSLNLKDGKTVTFMSDMQKGLIEAVKNVLPLSHHRYCVRHIEANWMKRFRSGEMKKLFWWAAWSTYEEDFKDQLSALGALLKSAAKDLLRYPPQTWCRAYLDTICKNQMVDNNFTESFNSWILEARGKPILKMLEDIRIKIMNRLREKEKKASKWTTDYSPKCMKLFIAYMRIAQLCSVDFNGDLGYEVSEGEDRHTVNLVEKKCTCRSWQLTGIPCPHAIKAMLYQKIEPKNEINWWYSKEAYLMTYRAKLMPVRGEQFWNVLPEHAMDPPDLVKTVGRPKTKRTKEKDAAIKRAGEWAHSRKRTKMTCSKCGETTHNVRTCNSVEGEQGAILKRKKGRTEEESEEEPQEEVEEAHGEDYDVNSSAPRPTQDEEYYFMSTPGLSQQQYEPFGPAREPESDPDIRPQVISENRTKLKMRMNQQRATGNRVISFRGDHAGINEPIDLPYSPTKLTWKGKEAVTGNQLERERQKKGCDTSVMLADRNENGTVEREAIPNMTLKGLNFIDTIKDEIEEECPGVVSCSDILVLETRDGIVLAGGPYYPVLTGRRDSKESFFDKAMAEIPRPNGNISETLRLFSLRGFDERETVALLGAHNIGRIGCQFIRPRLSNFTGTGLPDPTIPPDFLEELKQKCPDDNNTISNMLNDEHTDTARGLSVSIGTSLDNHYYKTLMRGRELLFADQQLMANEKTAAAVTDYAIDDGIIFRTEFAHAMAKMYNFGVLTGSKGEVRHSCSHLNS